LSAIDANIAKSGSQHFVFAGQNGTAQPNSVTWFESGGNTIIQADINGDHSADFSLVLKNINHHLSSPDFIM
jgi:hypothetical protein